MAGNKVDVIVNFKAMTNDVVHQLDVVKKKLNSMNLTNGAGDKLSQTIDQAYRKAEKFIDVLSKPIKDKADMSNISKSFEGLLGSVRTVENEIYKLSGKKIQVFDNNTLNTINTLKKGIQDARAELDKIGNSKLQTELNNLEKKASELQQKLRIKGVTGENWRIASGHAKQYIKALNEIDMAQQKINNKNTSKATRDAARQDLNKAKTNRDKYRGYIEKNLGFDKGKATRSQIDSFIAQQESINKLKAELNGLQSISDKAMNSLRQVFQSKGINMSANASINQYIAELEKIILEGNKASSVIKEMTNAIAKAGGVMNEQRGPATNLGQTFSQMTSWTEQMNQLQSYTAMFFNVYSAINLFKRAISSAYDTVKELDAAMTDTAVVTDFTVSDMWEQLPKYTQEANKLGATIQGAYETLTLYYQQGLSQNEAWGLGIETMKMARIAGMDYAEATDMMTAAIRGFKMELNETSARHVNDVFSELAAVTASDTYEISEAMTRTASLAYSTGMDFDTASVYLAEAIETTREAPENIGTALKTILARFQSLTKNPATLDADTQAALEGETVSANIVEAALKSAGIAARDTNGEFRDTADIFLELNEKWDSLDLMTQRYIATQAAGARQQSRFIAMMQNWSRTKELLTAAQNSEGASQKQFEKTLVSMEALTNKLKNSWDQFSMGIANSNFIKAGVKVLTTFLDVINGISGALGDSAIGQGFEALFKIGLAFAAWQLLPKIIGKVFNHLAKDMVGFGVEQAAMAAETESIIARMSAAYARMAAAFKPVGDAAAATAAEVTAANEAMAAGTAAGAAGAAGKMTKKGKILKIADALGLLAFSSIGGNKGKGVIGKIGAFFGGGEGGKGFKGAIAERKSKLPGWLNGQKAARDAYYNRNIANVGLNPKKVGSSVGLLGKVGKAASIGLSGLGTVLSAIPFGPAAAAAGALGAAIWGIAKVVKTPKERMEEANKVLENYQEQTKKIRTSREGISSIEDEFKALATGVDNAGKNIGLTTKQYERYKELVNELIKIHPSLVKGYDKNGQAIINNATAIKEINKALDEQEQRAIRKVTTDKNMNKILKGQIAVIRENNKELGAAANISSDWKSGGITYEKALKKSRKGDKLFLDAFKSKNGVRSKKNYQDYINEGLLNKSLGDKYAGGIDLSSLTYSETKDIVKSIPSIEKAARPLKESLSEIDQNNYDLLLDYLSKIEESYQINQDAINTVKDNLISFMNRKDSEGKSLMSGIPSDASDFVSTGLTALAEQSLEQGWDANELKQYTKDYAKLLQELGEGSNEYSKALRDIQDAQDEFNDSARNSEDVKKYNEAITEGTNVLSQLADQYRESGIESNIALAEALDSQINLLQNFASETQATVAEAMEPFGDLVDAAGGMAESIEDTINNIGDYYTAKDSIKGALDGIFEGIDTQGNGSKKFWETARQMMGQDVIDELGTKEAVQAQLKTLQGYFEEGEAGIAKFSQGIASHFDELNNAGFISKDGQLKWDTNGDLQQIAKIMQMNEQTLSALLEAGVQFGATDWSNYGQLGTAIKNANYSAKVGKKGNKTTLASKEKFKAEAQENQQYQNPEQFAGLVKKTLETNKDLSFYSVDRFKTEGRDLGVNDLAKQLNAFKGGKLDASKFDTKLINKFNESTENIGEAYKTFAKEGTSVDFGKNYELQSSYQKLVDAMKTNDESKINDAYSDFYQQLGHQLTTESDTEGPKTDAQKLQSSAQSLVSALDANTMALGGIPSSLATIGDTQIEENKAILEKGSFNAEDTQTYKNNDEILGATIKDLKTQLETAKDKGNDKVAEALEKRIEELKTERSENNKEYEKVTGYTLEGVAATKTTSKNWDEIKGATEKQKTWASKQEGLANVTISGMSKVFEGGGFKKMLEKDFTSTDQIKEEYGLKGKYADYNAQLLLDYINSQPKSEKTEKTSKDDVKTDSGKKEGTRKDNASSDSGKKEKTSKKQEYEREPQGTKKRAGQQKTSTNKSKTSDGNKELSNVQKLSRAYNNLSAKEKARLGFSDKINKNTGIQATNTKKVANDTSKIAKDNKQVEASTKKSSKSKSVKTKAKVDTKNITKDINKAAKKSKAKTKVNVDSKDIKKQTSKAIQQSGKGKKVKVQTDAKSLDDAAKKAKKIKGGKIKYKADTSALSKVEVPPKNATVNYSKIGKQVNPKKKSAKVNYTLGKQARPGDKKARVTYTGGNSTITVHVKGKAAKGMNLSSFGSAAAGVRYGKLGPNGKGGPTLTGELGQEMVWEPSSSSAYLVGTKGPEVVDLPGNAVVWPADQTKKILRGENHSKQLVGSEAKGTNFGSAGTFDYKKYLKVSTSTGSKASSGSKGSGGSKSSKSSSTKTNKKIAKTWENPYDEFYNLQRAINKEIRIREQLEKEYTRILKARNSTIKELINNVKQQLGELDTIMEDTSNYMYNKNLQAKNYVKSSKARTFVYNNSKGKEKKGTISASTLRKYAWWDEESKTVQINWNKLHALESKKDKKESTYYQEFGAAIEDYISKLEQFQDDYEDAEDKYYDALDAQTELLEEIAQNMFDAEEKVLDILVDVREKEIERLENINDSINDGNDRLMKSIQNSIDKIRRERDNEKTEETLAEKERRLAYLKQDTSGRNALEIKQLEKELKDERESYTDTLVDQSIDDIQSSMDEASEQRERQIEILNKQLEADQESGKAMKDVHKLMADAINPDGSINESSNLFKLLEASGDYQAASNQKRDFLLGELVQAVKNYGTYLGTSSTLKDAVKEGLVKADAQKTVTYEGKTYTGTVTSGGNFVGKTNTGEEIGIKGDKLAYDSTTGDTFIGTEPLDSSDIYNPSINGIEGDKTVTAPSVPTPTTTTPSKNTTTTSTKKGILSSLPNKRESASFSKAQRKSVQRGLNGLVSAGIITGVNGKKKGSKLKVNGKIDSASKKQMKKLQKKIGVKGKSYTGRWNPTTYSKFHSSKYYPAYKEGGLADFTGPAWLDGTKTRPEMVLNAQDTENFIKLKDTLSSLMKTTSSSSISSNDIININIDVKEIANDYDVDQMVNRVKKEITKAASNRNVNTITRRR